MAGKIRAGVWGARGYAGHELVKILLAHPDAEIVFLTARVDKDTPISEIFPDLEGRTDLVCQAEGEPPDTGGDQPREHHPPLRR